MILLRLNEAQKVVDREAVRWQIVEQKIRICMSEENWPNFHSLRASYTMNLLLNDTPVLKVQKILGHLDLKTTMHYIGELNKEDIKGTSVALFEVEKKKRCKLKAV